MLLKRFAQFVLKGRLQAAGLALLFAFLPFLGWVSNVIIALVTLRNGARDGLFVLVWAMLPYIVVGFLANWIPFFNSVLLGGLLIWGLALILRHYGSWALTLEFSALIAACVIAVIHLFVPSLNVFWAQYLSSGFHKLATSFDLAVKEADLRQAIMTFAHYATGFQAVIVLFGNYFVLMIARYMQALLFHPDGLRHELINIRMDRIMALTCMVCVVLAVFGLAVFQDILPVLALSFGLAGVSLVHGYMDKHNQINHLRTLLCLMAFYLFLIASAIFFPPLLLLVLLAAWADSFFDFRCRLIMA